MMLLNRIQRTSQRRLLGLMKPGVQLQLVKTIMKGRYRVTDIYDGNAKVPAGAHIEAKSKDGSLEFNCFVPNVQSNIRINYLTGAVTKNY